MGVEDLFIHRSSKDLIDDSVVFGERTTVWVNVQILRGARIGSDCIIGKDVFIDAGVQIGDRCKIQNGVSIYRGVTLEDGVFLGPNCATTNDLDPGAITASGRLKGPADWQLGQTLIRTGARIGASATILCGKPLRTIGRWALVGAGSVVTRDVQDFELVAGVPARHMRYVCPEGLTHRVAQIEGQPRNERRLVCHTCGKSL